jgi:hypothetical protein
MDELTIDDEHFFRIHGAIERCGFFTMAEMITPTWVRGHRRGEALRDRSSAPSANDSRSVRIPAMSTLTTS